MQGRRGGGFWLVDPTALRQASVPDYLCGTARALVALPNNKTTPTNHRLLLSTWPYPYPVTPEGRTAMGGRLVVGAVLGVER